jgi:hypothetical protein
MILGTISAVDADNGLQLIVDGEDLPTTKKYTYMASYVPTANDRVLIEEVGGSYVIVGKVINDVASSGIARTAETAINATNATNADNATNATNATNAETATNATNATNADNLKNSNTALGQLVYSVTRTYNSTIGSYIVTDVQLVGGQHNFIYKGL